MFETKIWSPDQLSELLSRQQAAYKADGTPDWAWRKKHLTRLLDMTVQHQEALSNAISQDFGNRHEVENQLGDFIMVIAGIKHLLKHTRSWMKKRRVPIDMQYWPATGYIQPQPVGAVGVIAPWNYPYHLAILPVAVAIAAGNRVMLKPSEVTPRTSALMEKLIRENFDETVISVVNGDAKVGQAFSELPFNHLFFTGSTPVGKLIAQAAAKNLTPVTLELGGKSPVVIDRFANLKEAAGRIAFAKLFNCGQTCVAPDYILVPSEMKEALIDALSSSIKSYYADIADNDDYTSIVSQRHYDRLKKLVENAEKTGARIVRLFDDSVDALDKVRKLPPVLIIDPDLDSDVMQEEIFGPLLPIISYDSVDEAIDFINERPRPLALYYFGKHNQAKKDILLRTISGGVTVNDCIWHVGQENLPFGGVGESGIGAYHGEAGFKLFTKDKPVFEQSSLSSLKYLTPPYGKLAQFLIAFVKKII